MHRGYGSEVTAAECWDLLGSESIGRLALSVRAMPALLPVQYYLDGGTIAICLGHYRVPRQSLGGTIVAFTVDAIDKASVSGWVVHSLGMLTLPQQLGAPTDCGQPTAGQVVHLDPTIITGHRVQLCPFLSR